MRTFEEASTELQLRNYKVNTDFADIVLVRPPNGGKEVVVVRSQLVTWARKELGIVDEPRPDPHSSDTKKGPPKGALIVAAIFLIICILVQWRLLEYWSNGGRSGVSNPGLWGISFIVLAGLLVKTIMALFKRPEIDATSTTHDADNPSIPNQSVPGSIQHLSTSELMASLKRRGYTIKQRGFSGDEFAITLPDGKSVAKDNIDFDHWARIELSVLESKLA